MIRRLFWFVVYVFVFWRELIKANIEVVKLVLSPKMNIRPGFLAVPMDAESDFEVTSLANSITLTPGTISVHVSKDRKVIVVHALDIGQDCGDVRHGIKATLEYNILHWTRPKAQLPPAPGSTGSPATGAAT